MKKIIRIILAVSMVLTMAVMATACGNDKNEENDESSKSSNEQTSQAPDNESQTSGNTSGNSVFPAALSNIEAYEVSDLANTGWELTGGMIDGVEMEQSDLEATLKACGGRLQFVFIDEGSLQMINGEKSFEGTYEIVQDNYGIHAVFTGYEYYGVFTEISGQTVMILANKTVPETALYMTQIDEH